MRGLVRGLAALALATSGCTLATHFDRPIADDAAARDATDPLDGAIADAAMDDASALDTGSIDAGPIDAGPIDAGPPDVGVDAYACDGSVPDCLGICGGPNIVNGCGQCVVDSASSVDVELVRGFSGYAIADGDWQSFVPTHTGDLTALEIEGTAARSIGLGLEVRADHSAGALLGSETTTVGATSIVVTFDPPAPVIAGRTYVMVMHPSTTDLALYGSTYGHSYLMSYADSPSASIWLRAYVRPCGG